MPLAVVAFWGLQGHPVPGMCEWDAMPMFVAAIAYWGLQGCLLPGIRIWDAMPMLLAAIAWSAPV